MRVEDFDFDLPEELIALRPARPRRSARLLVADRRDQTLSQFSDLAAHLHPGDLLVLNDTKVIPARLQGLRRRGEAEAKIEATLIRRESPDSWEALARPGKRLAEGDVITFGDLSAAVEAKRPEGRVLLRFDRAGAALDEAVALAGVPPLPPYIAARRAADEADQEDYQTLFARRPGAVAAPTASLHFDDEVFAALKARGVELATLTLHVGAGTFLPVKADDVCDHQMHAEWGEIDQTAVDAINDARARGGRVIAAGTTALRLLESTARETGIPRAWRGETDIFITPGFDFRVADGLITNFHLPRSTLFMLVSAFLGAERMRDLYTLAVAEKMRFYSYGDGSLLWR